MGTENTSEDIPVICETLGKLNSDGELTAKELTQLWGISLSCVYTYYGKAVPDFNKLRLIVQHARSRVAQRAVLEELVSGSGWNIEYLAADLDVNGDGVVNIADVIDATIKSTRNCADLLDEERGFEKRGLRRIDAGSARVMKEHL